jgi:hypothetical protein
MIISVPALLLLSSPLLLFSGSVAKLNLQPIVAISIHHRNHGDHREVGDYLMTSVLSVVSVAGKGKD